MPRGNDENRIGPALLEFHLAIWKTFPTFRFFPPGVALAQLKVVLRRRDVCSLKKMKRRRFEIEVELRCVRKE